MKYTHFDLKKGGPIKWPMFENVEEGNVGGYGGKTIEGLVNSLDVSNVDEFSQVARQDSHHRTTKETEENTGQLTLCRL